MSHLPKVDHNENLEFKWGKKRGVGGKKKEVRFYESFTYDGVDYALHDCVYLYTEGEPAPYIGKLIKIWELPDKTKKVKVHWFFQPLEIDNYLGDKGALDNEIFLASGEGAGVTNVNSLEAIAGKCNVICISKDSRNPQPSEQELQMADYIFYRTFDVRHHIISDRMDDKVAGLEGCFYFLSSPITAWFPIDGIILMVQTLTILVFEFVTVKFVFNRSESEQISGDPKMDSDKKEEALACNQTMQLSGQNPTIVFKTARTDGIENDLIEKGSEDVKDSLVERKSLPGGKPSSGAAMDSDDVATTSGQHPVEKTSRYKTDSGKNDIKMSKVCIDDFEVADKEKFAIDSGTSDKTPAKKSMVDVKALTTTITSSEKKIKLGSRKDILGSDKGVKSDKDDALEDGPSKKPRIDNSVKPGNKGNHNVQKLSINSDRNDAKNLATALTDGGKTKSEVASHAPDKDPKQRKDAKMTKLSNGKLLKVSGRESPSVVRETEGDGFEVTRKPDDERSRWFRLPWEERMKSAHEQGTLVEISNLDAEYTSGEVEDIIWHAFKENCTAKMVQRTAISSPNSGRAFIILKTRAAAERIIKELDDGCLMLSNGSPIAGSIAPPACFERKDSTFFGHLSVDKIKHQTQREMKEAVSTSHCSQSNTIEYEMAMEWCLLQLRSEHWWKQLYKQQGEDLRKLKANLKSK